MAQIGSSTSEMVVFALTAIMYHLVCLRVHIQADCYFSFIIMVFFNSSKNVNSRYLLMKIFEILSFLRDFSELQMYPNIVELTTCTLIFRNAQL